MVRKTSSTYEIIGPIIEKNAATMRNYGASQSRGHWLFFTDDDCSVDIEKLKKILSRYRNYDAIGGIYFKRNERCYFSNVYHEIQRKWLIKGIKGKSGDLPDTKHILGGAFAVKKSVFEEMGGFSEKIGWGAEETEFLNRMTMRNKKIGISYSLRVRHEKSLNFYGFLKRAWKQNFNLTYFMNPVAHCSIFKINYLKSQYRNLPAIGLFFAVGQAAQIAGRLIKQLKGLRWIY